MLDGLVAWVGRLFAFAVGVAIVWVIFKHAVRVVVAPLEQKIDSLAARLDDATKRSGG